MSTLHTAPVFIAPTRTGSHPRLQPYTIDDRTPCNQEGLDPDTISFTPGILLHAERVGFSLDQMRRAIAEPRWVNRVRFHTAPRTDESTPQRPVTGHPQRYRYCGHGVAVIIEQDRAIAVIADDLTRGPQSNGASRHGIPIGFLRSLSTFRSRAQ